MIKLNDSYNHSIISLSSTINDQFISLVSIVNEDKRYNFGLLNTFMFDSDLAPVQNLFPNGCHFQKIIKVASNKCRSLFSSISEDRTARVWNYSEIDTHDKIEVLSHKFREDPVALDMHPSGLFIAVGFPNS